MQFCPLPLLEKVNLNWYQFQKFSFKLEGVEVGGGSDGNFVSAAGLPVIDGMGAVGDGAHSLSERIDVTKTINRILLISSIINYL